jgi:uroporphyrinogen-III synthase
MPPAPLLHIGGVHRRGDVAGRLGEAGIPTAEVDVYDQRRLPLSQDVQQALAGHVPVIVPLFSPRAAQQFASLAHGSAPLHLVTISEAVMAQTRELPTASRQVAGAPDAASMRDALANLLRRVEADHSPQ